MLKSRLKFQFQVNSKFTSGGIFSQVAVSLFTLPSCSQVNFLPWIIKPSVGLRDCTIGHTLENTPRALHGCQSLCVSPSPSPAFNVKLLSSNPTLGISAVWFLLTWDPFASRAASLPLSRRWHRGAPPLQLSHSALCIFLGIKAFSSFKGKHKDTVSVSSGGH